MSDYLVILSQAAQMVGVLVIALLLWPVVRVIRERYLLYWAWGWTCLAVGLVALFLSLPFAREPSPAVAPLRVVYCLGGYGFAFLLWAGSRHYASARPLRPVEFLWLLPPAVYGLVGPFTCPTVGHLFGGHTAVLAVFFLAALWHTRRFHSRPQSAVARWVYQAALGGLVVLFAHYAVLVLCLVLFQVPRERFPYMAYSSAYDLALDAVLALSMVSIATERMRAELEKKNQKLAAAAAELELAARTDPLTGLLNRRGLADLLAQSGPLPAGCVASIDLNDLKPLNDKHGHAAGDVALRLVARGLRTLFRVTDPILRMGGDEFAVLMPGGSAAELSRRMELLDAALLNQRLPGVDAPMDLKVSWGVAAYRTAAELPAALAAADVAMYAQKRERKAASVVPAAVG
jgi:diguanylate cyclase (GGDEF)-like protein